MPERPLPTERTVHRLDQRGTVKDWLVTPSWPEPADDLGELLAVDGSPWGPDGRWVLTNGPDATPLKARLHAARPLRQDQPLPEIVENGPASYLGPTGIPHSGTWRRAHTAADGLVDWSAFCFTPEYRLALAATVLEVDQAGWRTLRLASTGPTLLYVAGECVAESDTVSYMEPVEHEARVWVPSGTTPVVVASWQVGFRECRQVVRLRVGDLPVRVVLPSQGADERVSAIAEQLLDAVGTPMWGVTSGVVALTGPPDVALRVGWNGRVHRVRLVGGKAELPLGEPTAADVPHADPGPASMLSTGEVVLTVQLDDERAPVVRELPVAVLPPHYRGEPVGDPARWRVELLEHAARTSSPAAELAGAALDPDHMPRPASLDHALWMIDNRADCADFEALGLLNLWHRVPGQRWPHGLRERLRKSLLGFKYWIDQPGLDAMCYFTENHQLVWHTAEMLAGEALADATFGNTGWAGERHAAHGAEMARAWITRKLAAGFSEFDSNAYLAIDTLALVSVVEFARDRELAAMAAGLLDKLLFTLAANSWRGVHGCAHGRSYVQTVRSSRLEETAPLMWVCWGTGALNNAVLPATVLATAVRYQVPDAVREAAHYLPEEWLGQQSYAGQYRLAHDLLARPYSSDAVIYKTPDAMLACVQDYRVGQPGLQEHVWGATLGPETQVYVTHAPNDSTGSSARPNAWAGNRIMPRARQYRDTVLALYQIPPGDPMGYTHAWFPLSTVDEWLEAGCWVAARRGHGYVALATDGGCRVVTAGPTANQELRARGSGTGWVCVVGRAAVDGSFREFVASLGQPRFDVDGMSYATRHGTLLRLDWDGPFTVDGRPVDLDDDGRLPRRDHLNNPLCQLRFGDPKMVIEVDGLRHVIDLRHGREVAT